MKEITCLELAELMLRNAKTGRLIVRAWRHELAREAKAKKR